LHWLHHGVILSTIASGILAFVKENGSPWGEFYAMAMLVLALFYCVYALYVFLWRADRIKSRIPGRWDDNFGPLFLGCGLALVLTTNLIVKLYSIATNSNEEL
jgi:threonine/homoserine/homoserine lactone efflux protein